MQKLIGSILVLTATAGAGYLYGEGLKDYLSPAPQAPYCPTAGPPDIMNKLARCVLALYSYDEQPDDISIENVLRQSIQLVAQLPTITQEYVD